MLNFLKSKIVITFIISTFFLAYLIIFHPVIIYFLVGEGKIISPSTNAIVKINGVESQNSLVFIESQNDRRIHLTAESIKLMTILTSKNDALIYDGGCMSDVLFSRYLFIANCNGLLYGSDKMSKGKPQMRVAENQIDLILPRFEKDGNNREIQIIFH